MKAQEENVGNRLEWIPLYIDRLLSSQRWRMMTDFQRGWYWSLIIESVRSERPGYLRLDRDLWRLAGAHSRQFFEEKNAVVLACFESRQIQGETWVFSGRLVRTMEEQARKYQSKSDANHKGNGIKINSPPLLTSVVLNSRTTKELPRKPDSKCAKCGGTGEKPLKAHPGKVIDCECLKTLVT